MHTLSLNDDELELLHQSVNTWINSFSHEEPDLLRAGKALRAKIDHELANTQPMAAAGGPGDGVTFAQ